MSDDTLSPKQMDAAVEAAEAHTQAILAHNRRQQEAAQVDEWNRRLTIVNGRLAEISQLTGAMAIAGTAKPGHPGYDALVADFDRMLSHAESLVHALKNFTKP